MAMKRTFVCVAATAHCAKMQSAARRTVSFDFMVRLICNGNQALISTLRREQDGDGYIKRKLQETNIITHKRSYLLVAARGFRIPFNCLKKDRRFCNRRSVVFSYIQYSALMA